MNIFPSPHKPDVTLASVIVLYSSSSVAHGDGRHRYEMVAFSL